MVNKKAHDLRVKLYKEHFGFKENSECEDPLGESTLTTIRDRAKVFLSLNIDQY